MSTVLYKSLAKYYDLIYRSKDYKKESDRIRELIKRYKKSRGKELLDVGCGTGRHLKYLKKYFSCTGLDKNKEMISIAKKNVKGVKFKIGDMMNFSLKKKFDVILCLFSTIGYVKSYTNLKKTLNNFSKHLKEGGVLIIEPWISPNDFKDNSIHMEVYSGKDIKLARAGYSRKRGNISIVYMEYLVVEKNKGIRHFKEKHEMGLFGVNQTLKIMKDVGLKSIFLKRGLTSGRGLYIGVKVRE